VLTAAVLPWDASRTKTYPVRYCSESGRSRKSEEFSKAAQ